MAFQVAGSLALEGAVEAAGVALLEPVVALQVVVPDASPRRVMGDLALKRGKIQGMEQISGGKHGSTPSRPERVAAT
jgi:elongation factor G